MTELLDMLSVIGLAVTIAAIAVALIFLFTVHIRKENYRREAARYERMERRRRDLKVQREKDRALAIEWCAHKIVDAERARDAMWIKRVMVMQRNGALR